MPRQIQRVDATITRYPTLEPGIYAMRLKTRMEKQIRTLGKVNNKFVFLFMAEQRLSNGQWFPCHEKIIDGGKWVDAPLDNVEPHTWKPALPVITNQTYGNLQASLTTLVHRLAGSQERADNWADTTNCDIDGFYNWYGVIDVRLDREFPVIFNVTPNKKWLHDWENRKFMCEPQFTWIGRALTGTDSPLWESMPDPLFGDDFPDPFEGE